MTDDPSTDDHDGYTINLGAPSVVTPGSERPDTAMLRLMVGHHYGKGTLLPIECEDLVAAADWIDAHRCPTPEPSEFILCDRCGRHGHYGEKLCEVCAEKSARPTPEGDVLAELRTALADLVHAIGGDEPEILAAVDHARRLLASHPGGAE